MKNHIISSIISICIKPRATIQKIVDKNPEDSVILLACLAGISNVLLRANDRGMGDTMELFDIILLSLILGPFSGVISLYVGSYLIHWTGKWIGGTSSLQNIRAAMAWASIPMVLTLLLLIPEIIVFGEEMYTTQTPIMDSSTSLLYAFVIFGVGVIYGILGIWSFILYLHCLGQVQGFSLLKTFGNILLAGLVIYIPIVLLLLVI